MRIVRRTLFESAVVAIGHVLARPSASRSSDIERQSTNVVVLPLSGVFARHDGPRQHVIATPNHAVLIAAGSPYRISLPADIGDQSLTLRFSGAALARLLPQAVSRDGFDSRAFASYGLLPPSTMLGRSLLWQRFARGEWDPVEVEELGIGLLISALHAVRKERRGRARGVAREGAGRRLRSCSAPTRSSPRSRSRRALPATAISRRGFARCSDRRRPSCAGTRARARSLNCART